MRLLLHVCCGPCTVFPLQLLRDQGHDVSGLFYNPNIHPYREFNKRIGALEQFAELTGFQVAIDRRYGLTSFLREVVFHEQERCGRCYDMRLARAAKTAAEQNLEAFTTTLLYSTYQDHQLLVAKGEQLARRFGVPFLYQDFREGWQSGIDQSIEMNLYRQPYCGCIYSEQERYDKAFKKRPEKCNE